MKKILKWIGIIIGGLIFVAILAAAALVIFANLSFKKVEANRPLYPITADLTPAGIERGKYLMEQAMLCTEACHTPEDGPALSGVVFEIHERPIDAAIGFPNLTSDVETGLGGWQDAEIARAIREGVDKDGVGLIIMPAYSYNALSDADVAAVIGYLRRLAPVKNEIPPMKINVVGKVMMATGQFGPGSVQKPITQEQVNPPSGTVEYGKYMVMLGGCIDCHHANLAGGTIPFAGPGSVPAANLTPGGELVGWTVDDFVAAVHNGVKPSGDSLNEEMPRYKTSVEDLQAIFAYLQSLPALPMNK